MPIAGKLILDLKPVAENALFIAVSSAPKLEENQIKIKLEKNDTLQRVVFFPLH